MWKRRDSVVRGFALALAVAVLLAPGSARAQSDPSHLVTLNNRTFDLATDVSKMRRDPDFVPMNEIDWLAPLLDADPLLGPVVFHLKVADPSTKSASWMWRWEGSLTEGPGYGQSYDYKYVDNIPVRFQIPGYETRSANDDGLGPVMMIPTDIAADYSVMCSPDRQSGKIIICIIIAAYPPDPLIYLQARLYAPEPWDKTREELDDIVARMREIAYCLDVTDRALELAPEGVPKTSDCRNGVGM